MSSEEAEILLTQACDDAVTGTIKGAIETMIDAVESPIEKWTVGEAVDVILPGKTLRVGQVTYARRVPPTVARKAVLQQVAEHFGPPVGYVTIEARGWQTARFLAAERFAESAAILDLMERPDLPRSEGSRWWAKPRRQRAPRAQPACAEVRPSQLRRREGATGSTVPAALAGGREGRECALRLERRVLAAARWLSLGLNSIWAADRLVAVMVALECLFVEGPSEQYKGAAIARRFTERFEMHERTAEEQEEWLVRLYRSRNAAAHEGRSFTDDLDVDRLTELTHYVVREMSYHLIPGHRRPGRSCRTWRKR